MDRLDEVLSNAAAAGVGLMICPGIDPGTSREAVGLAASHGLRAAVGIHPAESLEAGDRFGEIERMAFEPGVFAVGESGLDLRPGSPSRAVQSGMLAKHVALARDLDLTLILHSRSAEEELLSELPRDLSAPVVLHCYTGGGLAALEAADRGFFVSFAGALTFRRNDALRETLSRLPREQVLVETDSPFMAPEPVRGRTCEPAFVVHTAGAVAAAWGLPAEEASAILLGNSHRAFRTGPLERPSAVYILGRRAYVNLTGKCCNSCRFCIRNLAPGLGGYRLSHSASEPSEARVLGCISRLSPEGLDELVFCGYGEPTARPALLRSAATLARSLGWRLRLNTNGLGLCFAGEEETLGMLQLFDTVSISLNAHDAASYEALCRPSVLGAWESLMAFAGLASRSGVEVRLSAVAWDGVDLSRVRETAAKLGLPLVTRGA